MARCGYGGCVSDEPSGLERAFFPGLTVRDIDRWLDSAVSLRLGSGCAGIAFRAGRIDAVYGLRLDDGRAVVVKLHRAPVDLPALLATTDALRHLAATGYPCPTPVDGPAEVDGRIVSVQSLLSGGVVAEARRPDVRRAMTASLADQVLRLRAVPGGADRLAARLGAAGPAWTRYADGPWPRPHDPIFDFRVTPSGWEWIDDEARSAADELLALRGRFAPVVGHGDWYAGNLRFTGGQVTAVFDWDLVAEPEAVLAGLSAGGFLMDGAPSPEQVAGFLADYERAHPGTFEPDERRAAVAAARWVLAFNARCDLAMLDGDVVAGSPLDRFGRDRAVYRDLAW